MGKQGKKRDLASEKCKTPVAAKSEFSKNWMGPLIASALRTGDVVAACQAADVPLGHYLTARRTDATFAAACVEIDLITRHAATAKLSSEAASGRLNASKLKLWLQVLQEIKVEELPDDGELSPLTASSLWPPWMRWLVRTCTGPDPDPRIRQAVWHATLQAVGFYERFPEADVDDFTPHGPCLNCSGGYLATCPECKYLFVAAAAHGFVYYPEEMYLARTYFEDDKDARRLVKVICPPVGQYDAQAIPGQSTGRFPDGAGSHKARPDQLGPKVKALIEGVEDVPWTSPLPVMPVYPPGYFPIWVPPGKEVLVDETGRPDGGLGRYEWTGDEETGHHAWIPDKPSRGS